MSPAAAPVATGVWPRWSEMDKPARRAAVIALAADGCTASGIAAKLGATRGAVIGFCWRQDLELPGVSFKASVSQRREKPGVTLAGPAVGRRPRAGDEIPAGSHGGGAASAGPEGNHSGEARSPEPTAVASGVGTSDPAASAPAAQPSPALRAPSPPPAGTGEGGVAGPIGFMALTDERCKRPLWPDGPVPKMDAQLFCGAPSAAGSSWCRACTRRLLAGAPQPQRRAWRGG